MSWSTTPPAPIIKPGWTTDPTITIPSGNQQWAVHITPRVRAALRAVQAAMIGEVRQHGTIATQLRHALFTGTGAQTQTGDIAALLRAATFTGTNITLGQLDTDLTPLTATLNGGQRFTGTMGAALKPARANVNAQHIITGSIATQLPHALATIAGTQGIPGTLAAQLKTLAAAAAGSQTISGTIAAQLRKTVLAANAQQIQTGTLATELRAAIAAATGTVKSIVQYDNFDSLGTGGGNKSGPYVNNGNCIVVILTNTTSSGATCTYGGVNIPRLTGPTAGGSFFPYTAYCSIFGLASNSLPQGSNTLSLNQGATASAAAAVSFSNAASLSASADTASGNVNKASATGDGRAAVAGYTGGSTNFGVISPNELLRHNFISFNTWSTLFGYGLDTGSGINFSSTHSGAKAGAVVTILPN